VDLTPNIADLSVTKTGNKTHPDVGEDVTFTIVASNSGPNDATNARVTDVLPGHLTYKSSSATAGSYNNGTGIWSIGTLANGGSETLTLVATVNQVGSTTNTATISADPFDPVPGDNSDSYTFDQLIDLAVGKTVDDANANYGQIATFTITVTNAGPNAATGVVMHDALPAGLTWSADTPSQGIYNHTTGDWTVGSISAGGSATLTLEATVATGAPATNTASVGAVNEPQTTTANDSASATVTPPQADLEVEKTVDVARPDVGDSDSFTITVTNNGPDTATNVALSDILPAGIGYDDATPSTGSYDPDTGVWTVGTLANGAGATLTIDVIIDATGDYTNTASVSHSDQYDPVPANNSDSAQLWTRVADIAVTKTVDEANPPVGSVVKFTITATNTGPDPATLVVVADNLTADYSFISSNPSQGSYDSASGLWTVGSLAVSDSATLEIDARVLGSGSISNTASLDSLYQRDQNPANDSDTATEDVPPAADLSLTKTVDNPHPDLGTNVTYTLTVTNHGPNDTTGLAVEDVLPAGMTYVSSLASAGSYDSDTSTWTVGDLADGDSETLSIVATITNQATITNTAEISASDLYDPDSTPGNAQAGEDDIASATITPTSSDLMVAKIVDDPNPDVGATVTFTVTATNNGPDAATGVHVTDSLPAGLTYQSSTPSVGSYDDSTGVWTIGNLANGASATLDIVATVDAPGTITNTAVVAGNQYDPDPSNNTATSDTDQLVDIVVTKTVDDADVNVGSDATFTISVANSGPGTAHGVMVSDVLPAGLTFVAATPDQGSYDSGTGDWTIGTMARSGTTSMTLVATVGVGSPITNTASVTAVDEPQSSTANDSASATVTPPNADLVVTKTVDVSRPDVGDDDSFTVTIRNDGPDDATNVVVFDMPPAGLTYADDTPSQGSYDVDTGLWTVGGLANGASATLILEVTVSAAGDYTNTASVTLRDQFDPDNSNDSGSASLSTRVADIGVTKAESDANPAVGTDVTFTVTAANNGPDDASQVVVGDLLPVGLTFVAATPSVGTYDPATGAWSIGVLANGAGATIDITAHVVGSGAITNTAAVSHVLQRDPNADNDSGSASLDVPPAADLSVSKEASDDAPNLNDHVVFTVRVTNHGPNGTSGIHVSDLLPAGLTYVSSTPSTGAYDSDTGDWDLGSLGVGASATLAIEAEVTIEGPIVNTAQVTASNLPDPDSTPANDQPGEDDQASVTLNSKGVADLSLTKQVTSSGGRVGTQAVYRITVHNAGPDAASGVIVRDQLPAGLTFVSASGGSYDAATGAWTVGNLGVGASATLTITTQIGAPGSITNVSEVAASDQRDPNSTPGNGDPTENDESSAGLTAGMATLPPTATNVLATPLAGGVPLWLIATFLAALVLVWSVAIRSRSRRRMRP
jgi:uncharacterized repeat protein (TIGR01451 family)